MPTAKESLDRYEHQIDWQKLVDMAMQDPPCPWELAAWLGHYSRDFDIVYGGWPTLWDYPDPVRTFFETLARITPVGRPCRDERHLVKVRQAWTHAVFRDGYEMNLDMARLAKDQGIPYNGRIMTGETPSMAVIGDIAESTEFGIERVKNLIHPRKKMTM